MTRGDEGEEAVVGDALVEERRQQQHRGGAELAGMARQGDDVVDGAGAGARASAGRG